MLLDGCVGVGVCVGVDSSCVGEGMDEEGGELGEGCGTIAS